MLGPGIDMSLESDYANHVWTTWTRPAWNWAGPFRTRPLRPLEMGLSEPNGVGWCHLFDKESLEADLYIEDDPAMLDRLMDSAPGARQEACLQHGAVRNWAMRSDVRGAVFDDWTQVPGLRGTVGSEAH